MQMVPTLGPKVYKLDLLWAVWSPRVQGGELYSSQDFAEVAGILLVFYGASVT